jgi:hypothetical protein
MVCLIQDPFEDMIELNPVAILGLLFTVKIEPLLEITLEKLLLFTELYDDNIVDDLETSLSSVLGTLYEHIQELSDDIIVPCVITLLVV